MAVLPIPFLPLLSPPLFFSPLKFLCKFPSTCPKHLRLLSGWEMLGVPHPPRKRLGSCNHGCCCHGCLGIGSSKGRTHGCGVFGVLSSNTGEGAQGRVTGGGRAGGCCALCVLDYIDNAIGGLLTSVVGAGAYAVGMCMWGCRTHSTPITTSTHNGTRALAGGHSGYATPSLALSAALRSMAAEESRRVRLCTCLGW